MDTAAPLTSGTAPSSSRVGFSSALPPHEPLGSAVTAASASLPHDPYCPTDHAVAAPNEPGPDDVPRASATRAPRASPTPLRVTDERKVAGPSDPAPTYKRAVDKDYDVDDYVRQLIVTSRRYVEEHASRLTPLEWPVFLVLFFVNFYHQVLLARRASDSPNDVDGMTETTALHEAIAQNVSELLAHALNSRSPRSSDARFTIHLHSHCFSDGRSAPRPEAAALDGRLALQPVVGRKRNTEIRLEVLRDLLRRWRSDTHPCLFLPHALHGFMTSAAALQAQVRRSFPSLTCRLPTSDHQTVGPWFENPPTLPLPLGDRLSAESEGNYSLLCHHLLRLERVTGTSRTDAKSARSISSSSSSTSRSSSLPAVAGPNPQAADLYSIASRHSAGTARSFPRSNLPPREKATPPREVGPARRPDQPKRLCRRPRPCPRPGALVPSSTRPCPFTRRCS